MAGVPPDAPCLTCLLIGAGPRRRDDPLHGQAELGDIANAQAEPMFPQHPYDPGERRKGTRRGKDRTDEAWDEAEKHRRLTDWNREHPKK